MIPEIGHLALILALCLALAQAFFGLAGAQRGQLVWMSAVRPAAVAQSLFVALAFGALAYCFLTNDFSVAYVAENSNTALPWFYKFTAVWGAHEGSLLLWIFVLAIWTVGVARFSRHLPQEFSSRVLGVLGVISIGFLVFMLATSDPFTRLLPPVTQGRDLNPILQDPMMVTHPPMLYMGYVGLSVAFAFAIAALLSGKMDSVWARWSRPWTILAWLFLTIGIIIGSYWAYTELGWGGWWFWDPVENASFMPWLVATALMHSLAVTEKRGAFKSWTALLAIAAFSLSLLGTFLVRSGVLISVHAFAVDPKRGVFILGLIGVFVGAALALYAWRSPTLSSGGGFKPFSREAFLLLNNIFLVVAAAAVLLGTLYPLVMDALHLERISVGPPYFDTVFIPLMIPFFILIGIGPYVRWKHGELNDTAHKLWWVILLAVIAGLVALILLQAETTMVAIAGLFLGAWTIVAALREPVYRLWQRARGMHLSLPRSVLGMTTAHVGAGLLILGVTVTSTLGITRDLVVKPGSSVTVHGYQFTYASTQDVSGPNYQGTQVTFHVSRDGKQIAVMRAEKRTFTDTVTSVAAIYPGVFRDLYVGLGNPLGDSTWSVRFQYKPLVRFIWFGGLVMMLGGVIAVSDRRYRRRVTESAAIVPATPPLLAAMPVPAPGTAKAEVEAGG
ncbi:MAG: heme lyase CcmF/NrfE family subunit [Gammaproteobacteria bacterium]|nr:heme lyase CcmF/NrfE family subunit [Gammaproteobacteria bacterium]